MNRIFWSPSDKLLWSPTKLHHTCLDSGIKRSNRFKAWTTPMQSSPKKPCNCLKGPNNMHFGKQLQYTWKHGWYSIMGTMGDLCRYKVKRMDDIEHGTAQQRVDYGNGLFIVLFNQCGNEQTLNSTTRRKDGSGLHFPRKLHDEQDSLCRIVSCIYSFCYMIFFQCRKETVWSFVKDHIFQTFWIPIRWYQSICRNDCGIERFTLYIYISI